MSTSKKDNLPMPQSPITRISQFYGISIEMGFEDEDPPHVHVNCDGKEAKVGLDNEVLAGWLPPIGSEMVHEWISKYQKELEYAWDRCSRREYPLPIPPLYNDEPQVGPGHLYLMDVESVEVREGYRIWVSFEDGACGEVDLSHLAGKGVFRAWNDRSFFESVYVKRGVVTWKGDIDLDPCQLYMEVTGKAVEEIWPGLRPGYKDA